MYTVATILLPWLVHFQNPYHHSRSPTKRCHARLFIYKMLFLDVAPCPIHPYFHHIVPPNLILYYCCLHGVFGRILSSWNLTWPFPLTYVKRERWCFGCVSRLASFLENCLTPSSKNSSLSLSDQCNWWRVSYCILVPCSRGIAHLLHPSTCVAYFLSRKIY